MLSSFDITEQAQRNVLGRMGFVPTNFLKKGDFLNTISFGDCSSFVGTNQISDRSVGPGTIWDANTKSQILISCSKKVLLVCIEMH